MDLMLWETISIIFISMHSEQSLEAWQCQRVWKLQNEFRNHNHGVVCSSLGMPTHINFSSNSKKHVCAHFNIHERKQPQYHEYGSFSSQTSHLRLWCSLRVARRMTPRAWSLTQPNGKSVEFCLQHSRSWLQYSIDKGLTINSCRSLIPGSQNSIPPFWMWVEPG